MGDFGRVTKALVSGYQRDRVHYGSLIRGEKRKLVANFNGAFDAERTIESATWRTTQNWGVYMADAEIDGRSTQITITAQWGNNALVKCEVTLDNGEVYNQLFALRVQVSPWFQGETNPTNGPTELTATA